MLMFTVVISCLTPSNLPWFMDLTLQVPKQYCSLQHQTLLKSPVTSPSGCFCFGSISSFFLELFSPLYSSSILGTYWPGEFIFQCYNLLLFHTVHGDLKAGRLKWFAIPFSSVGILKHLSLPRPHSQSFWIKWLEIRRVGHFFKKSFLILCYSWIVFPCVNIIYNLLDSIKFLNDNFIEI